MDLCNSHNIVCKNLINMGKIHLLWTFLLPIKCRYCEFVHPWCPLLRWTSDILVCDRSCPEALFAVQLQKMGSYHWPQRILILRIFNNGFEDCCSCYSFVCNLVSNWHGSSRCCNSFFIWLFCTNCIWESFGQSWVSLLASSPCYIWGLSIFFHII